MSIFVCALAENRVWNFSHENGLFRLIATLHLEKCIRVLLCNGFRFFTRKHARDVEIAQRREIFLDERFARYSFIAALWTFKQRKKLVFCVSWSGFEISAGNSRSSCNISCSIWLPLPAVCRIYITNVPSPPAVIDSGQVSHLLRWKWPEQYCCFLTVMS